MKQQIKKEFDTVAFFRAVKEKIAKETEGMTLSERRAFFEKIRKNEAVSKVPLTPFRGA
jgi:hypothetical protein